MSTKMSVLSSTEPKKWDKHVCLAICMLKLCGTNVSTKATDEVSLVKFSKICIVSKNECTESYFENILKSSSFLIKSCCPKL